MSEALLWVVLVLVVAAVALLVVLVGRSGRGTRRADPLRDELRAAREEASRAAAASRQELVTGLSSANQTLAMTLTSMGDVQR